MKFAVLFLGLFLATFVSAEPLKARPALPRTLDGISLKTTYEVFILSPLGDDYSDGYACSYHLEEGDRCLSKKTEEYSIMVYFRGNTLLRIQRLYGDSIRWETFIAPTIKKYGPPGGKELIRSTEYLLWEDGRTHLELQNDMSDYPRSQYSIVLSDVRVNKKQDEKEMSKAPAL